MDILVFEQSEITAIEVYIKNPFSGLGYSVRIRVKVIVRIRN